LSEASCSARVLNVFFFSFFLSWLSWEVAESLDEDQLKRVLNIGELTIPSAMMVKIGMTRSGRIWGAKDWNLSNRACSPF
jgi:hypothetical protein